MILAKVAVLILGVAGLGAAIHLISRWSGGSPGRRPGARSLLTRILCGAAGGAILVAFGIVTVRTSGPRVVDVRGPRTLRVPALPPPAEESGEDHRVPSGRFLLHLAVVRAGQVAGPAIVSETFDLRWPLDRNRRFVLDATVGHAIIEAELMLGEVRWKREYGWEVEGSKTLVVRTPNSDVSQSGGIAFPSVDSFGRARGEEVLLSLRGIPGENMALLTDWTPVREDDPLRPGDVGDLIALRGPEPWLKLRSVQSADGPLEEDDSPGSSEGPALALARVLGINCLPLLAAAILLAQLSRRRWPGFVRASAAILLYLGALDRFALRISESRARDAALPVETRLLACRQMRSTAFFRKTALEHLHALGRDAALPPAVRDRAIRLGLEK